MIKLFESEEEALNAIPKGAIRKLIVKGKELVITHSSNGLSVTEPLCPHMKEPLHKGNLNAFNEIICSLHEYRFNLSTGVESSNRCHDLTIYKLMVSDDGVYIEL